MKQKYNKWFITAMVVSVLAFNACVDDIKFGNSFLDKASGSSVTKDTVFGSAEYTKQFLAAIYAYQFYGLTYNNAGTSYTANCNDTYNTKSDAMTDLCNDTYTSAGHWSSYYQGTLNANYAYRGVMFHYNYEFVWESVRAC